MHLTEEFTNKVKRVWGANGVRWLGDFPDTLAACVGEWELRDLVAFPNLSYNFIASAWDASGQPVILKLGVPNPELISEVSALQAYAGRGAVRLLAHDLERGALLLERLLPGRQLASLNDNRKESQIAAEVMAKLLVPPPDGQHFPSLTDWAQAFKRIPASFNPEDYGLPPEMLETARRYVEDLTATAPHQALLHGDLHHFNILYDERRGWTAIDPKGVIGDPAYQPARFFSNPVPDFPYRSDPLRVTRQRLEVIATALDLDPQRILTWAYVDCMLGACWNIEEGASARYFVECAGILTNVMDK